MMPRQPVTGKPGASGLTTTSTSVQRQLVAAAANIFSAQVISADFFPAAKDQVSRARRLVKNLIPGDPDLDTIVWLVAELAANAVLHSGSSFFGLILARTTMGELRVAVADEGREGYPCLRRSGLESESGRGLQLVETLAQRWGILRQAGIGAAVWFDVR